MINRRRGFTMIELLVAATIMIVLTTIGLVSYQNASRNGRNAKRKSDLETVRQSVVLYKTDMGVAYPTGTGATGFTSLLTTIADYISATDISDPKSPTHNYTYDSDGVDFSLCATIELPSNQTESYCVENP